MDNMFQGLNHVTVYLHDILITSCTKEEHLKNLEEVLSRPKSAGAHLKKKKCYLMSPQVDKQGLHLTKCEVRVRAILEAPSPQNVTER